MTLGMGMIIADHLVPALARGTVRAEQRDRIDLEAPPPVGRHIRSRQHRIDPPVAPEQQPAALLRRGGIGGRVQLRQHSPCHDEFHPQIVATMGGHENTIEGVLAPEGGRLDKALAEASGLSRERVKALLAEGRVTLAGKAVSQASLKAPGGSAFAISVPQPAPAEAVAQDIPLVVAFEDADLIVIDKPAGLVVHPAAGNADGTLVNALLHHCAGNLSGIGGVARPGIVHRIDKDTSGLLVAAKSNRAHEGLAAQFADHSIERAYHAVAAGRILPSSGTVNGAIARSSHDRKKMALVEDGRGKHAVTHYRTMEPLTGATLVECRLETGRTHQVRVHLASIGHPLLGDPVYGRTPPALRPVLQRLSFRRQALHAAELGFVHPVTGERAHFVSRLPDDMRTLIDELRH